MRVSTPARSNNFNLLRLLFATLVIVAHTPEILDGDRSREALTQLFGTLSFGGFAVDSFFLLSGYLIVKSWVVQPSFFKYFRNRILRIYPGFIAASLVCALFVAPLGASSFGYFDEFAIGPFLKGLLFLYPPLIPSTFEGTHYPVTNGSMWTIRFEFLCYVLVAAVGMLGGFKVRRQWMVLTALLAAGFALGRIGGITVFEYPLFRLGMHFGVGGLFYLYGRPHLGKPRLIIGCAVVLLPCLFSHWLAEFAMAACWGYIVLSFAEQSTPSLSGFNRLPDVSYGVYLYAWPVTKLLLLYAPGLTLLPLMLLTMVLSLVMGVVSWYGIEKPFMLAKDRLRWPRRVQAVERPAAVSQLDSDDVQYQPRG